MKKPGSGPDILRNVQRHFPQVTTVKAAENNLEIEVLPSDEKASKRRNHEECAMAVACKRAYKADGVIIARSVAYLVKGTLAIRFLIPESVSREITSFDRGGPFNPGTYHLQKPNPAMDPEYRKKINAARERDPKEKKNGKGQKKLHKKRHITQGIRAILGGIDDKA
jgi:hypothetical protein